MLRTRLSIGLALAALSTFAPAFGPGDLSAQDQPEPPTITTTQFGIGYVANAPHAWAGGSIYVITPRWGGIGLYVDAKFDVSSPEDELGYDDRYTAQEVEGEVGGDFVRAEDRWWSANVAVVRPISRYVSLYVGGGVATRTVYNLYANTGDVGVNGVAWVKDPVAEETGFNLMFGGITRLTSRFSAHFGWETEPGGVTAGISLRLPRW